jgi:hypothetical protein
MADDKRRNPKNAAGPFYVLDGVCMWGDCARTEAPDLVSVEDEVGCYFKRQPELPEEIDSAVRAMHSSCIGSYRYGGTDPEILHRLAEAGRAELCDHARWEVPVEVRRYVRFSYEGADDAMELATSVVEWFNEVCKRGACTTPVEGDGNLATFHFTKDREHGTPLRYAVKKLLEDVTSGARSPAEPAPYRLMAERENRRWLLAQLEGEVTPMWLYDVLVAHGCKEMRWFSVDEWNERAPGRVLPF